MLIISFTELTHETGETVIMLDSFGISKGMILSPPYSDTSQIEKIIKDTSLKSFVIIERNIAKIFELLQKIDLGRVIDISPVVVIDQYILCQRDWRNTPCIRKKKEL
ncbi:hypothetical protein MBGDC06_00709 [Thermoplasmatales archaeon SCGC AB-539-C06]|nr:hypothetical protein MBGDC06_00709 [Thermoplasmatales archaeon SCGC AB-539-C06]